MPLTYTNLDALVTAANINKAQESLSQSIQRLSSGLRINSAKDDPAGLAVSVKMTTQIRSLGQAIRNTNDAVSTVQVKDSAYDSIESTLASMRDLAVQAAGTSDDASRALLNTEYASLKAEIDALAQEDVGANTTLTFQVGPNAAAAVNRIAVVVTNAHASAIGASGTVNAIVSTGISTVLKAGTAINSIDRAITTISRARTNMGAALSRFSLALDSLSTRRDNLTAANSAIVSADVATETANYTRQQIVVSGSIALLAQANLSAADVLKLLG